EPLLHVAALLVADQRDRAAVELAEPGDEGAVVRATAVAVQLDPVGQHALDVVQRVRAVGMARELDGMPDRLVARVRLQALELLLEPLGLAFDLGAAEKRQPREAREPLAQVQLLVPLGHANSLSSFTMSARCCSRGMMSSRWPKRRFCSASPKSSG